MKVKQQVENPNQPNNVLDGDQRAGNESGECSGGRPTQRNQEDDGDIPPHPPQEEVKM